MTAEIGVLNKYAVALAADSAVTIGAGKKIFPSANKIFALSKHRPIGVMVYGSAHLLGMPWETVIKHYREALGERSFDRVQEYVDHFITFLEKAEDLFPPERQARHAEQIAGAFLESVRDRVLQQVQSLFATAGAASDEDIKKIVREVVKNQKVALEDHDYANGFDKSHAKEVADSLKDFLDKRVDTLFEKLPLQKSHRASLCDLAVAVLTQEAPDPVVQPFHSGIVVAGFGEREFFPVLMSYTFETIVNGRLKHTLRHDVKISDESSGAIVPFAQREMVNTFMEGIDPALETDVSRAMEAILVQNPMDIVDSIDQLTEDEKAKIKKRLAREASQQVKRYRELMQQLKEERYVNPVTNIVAMLPKNELADMAESLVSLTSFKRKMSMDAETVGGPVDVAVISRGDGFIWMRRKHYFDASLNQQFFANYYRDACTGGAEEK